MQRLLIGVLAFLTIVLQAQLWFGATGLPKTWALEAQTNEQAAKNLSLKNRNAGLVLEVNDLKQGTVAVEEYARFELGMIKPSETFYHTLP